MKKFTLIIMAAAMFSSCASRQKDVHKEKSKNLFESTIDTASEISVKQETTSMLHQSFREWYRFSGIKYEGETDSSSLVIEHFDNAGNSLGKTKFSGKSKGSFETKEGTTEKKHDEEASAVIDLDQKNTGSTNINAEAYNESLDKHVETSGMPSWAWWLILLIVVLALALRYRKKIAAWFTR